MRFVLLTILKPSQTSSKTENPARLSVGPAPPAFELRREDFEHPEGAQRRFREHNLLLARSLGRHQTSNSISFEFQQRQRQQQQQDHRQDHHAQRNGTEPARSNSLQRNSSSSAPRASNWQEDLYRDFESVYRSLCEQLPAGARERQQQVAEGDPVGWSAVASREAERLDRSLAGLSEAAERHWPAHRPDGNLLEPPAGATRQQQVSPAATSELTRADSRNTNQSLQTSAGPALVEEMTLSDLEEEICSTLMAAREAARQNKLAALTCEQLVRGRRSRQPLPANLISSRPGRC